MSKIPASVRVFSIPPGAPFLRACVGALTSGELIAGFPDKSNPFALASAKIFVPTRRAARALAQEFVLATGRRVAMLPTIIPLGHVEMVELDLADDSSEANAPISGPLRPVSEFERRLALASLIREWAGKIKHAIIQVDDFGSIKTQDDEPILIGTSLAAAWSLAGDLGALIDEFTIENIPWSALDGLMPDEFDKYWGITHEFLKIATGAWPRYLAERGLLDRAQHQIRQIDTEIAQLSDRTHSGPVLVFGSTGANTATARLLDAIARLPNGAIVLPGLDHSLDEAAWSQIIRLKSAESEGVATHPQAAMANLLSTMNVARGDVRELGAPSEAAISRNRLLSEALRPAETTDIWHSLHASGAIQRLVNGLDGVMFVEAADEREEALCIAIKLRECHELERSAALITPDRKIARRVQSELERWGINVGDSAGEPLGRTCWGSYARLLLNAAGPDATGIEMLAVLSHKLARFGLDRDILNRLVRLLDIAVLRGMPDLSQDAASIIEVAREQSKARSGHPNAKSIGDDDWIAIQALIETYQAVLDPFKSPISEASIAVLANRHAQAIDASLAMQEPSDGDGRLELENVFALLIEHGHFGGLLDHKGYAILFDQVISDTAVRQQRAPNQKIQILGLLEARLLEFDTVIAAGLDEGVWPPNAQSDPFLNRPMRASLGMSAPERRIGQTAHDLVQLLGAPEAMITRAAKRDGAPTVPSRFAQRIAALAGDHIWKSCGAHGAKLVSLSRRLDVRERQSKHPPAPRPPIEMRPLSLSVTRIETLRRDPYSIYAERILRLTPVEPLAGTLGLRDFGTVLHAVIEDYCRHLIKVGATNATLDALISMARVKFSAFLEQPGFEDFKWPQVLRILAAYSQWEQLRAPDVNVIHLENTGVLKIPLNDGAIFTLTARADRIESWRDGTIRILDFKSGRVPAPKEIIAGFAPQLVLETKIFKEGGFSISSSGAIDAVYIKLGGSEGLNEKSINGRDYTLDQLVEEQFQGLAELLNQLRLPDTPFLSRPYPQFLNRFGNYDHLARVKEWSAGADDGDPS